MKKALVIYKRELSALVVSPLSAVVGFLFLLATGYYFSLMLIGTSRLGFYPILFRYMANIMLIFVPLLTMGLLAGERERGSVALLFTSPVQEWEIVTGKWAAVYSLLVFYLLMTLPFAAILFALGDPDPGPIFAGYIGILLLSASFAAIGLFASSLSQSSIVAAVVGFGLMLFFGIVERLKDMAGESFGKVCQGISYIPSCRDFFSGVIYAHHIVFFISLTLIFLFATQRVLSSNRWH